MFPQAVIVAHFHTAFPLGSRQGVVIAQSESVAFAVVEDLLRDNLLSNQPLLPTAAPTAPPILQIYNITIRAANGTRLMTLSLVCPLLSLRL